MEAEGSADDEDNGIGGLPPESEEGSDREDATTSLQASLLKRRTTAMPTGPAPRIQHREGEPQASLTVSATDSASSTIETQAVRASTNVRTNLLPGPITSTTVAALVFDIVTGKKERYSEHALIAQALEIAFFGNVHTSVGFLHPELFDPIPDQALAFIHTVIHAHICEWSTGRYIREDFSASKNSTFYTGFLADFRSYGSKNPTAWLNIRKRMYSRAFRAGGGDTLQVQITRVSTAAMEAATAELEGRTGLTDSEEEGEVGAAV
ncbi:hypothetical protein BD311DRAFT_782943 [Dichomitus squalens]|uniref:DUF6532 domain-containing protein n=1 Tax=Dichomitus squalens TaxID=114155 RepID=A0A4Q9M3G9_9APHY|nr:hypothetical protein BD311DRAFT_782943 [Dichomitus squalens]